MFAVSFLVAPLKKENKAVAYSSIKEIKGGLLNLLPISTDICEIEKLSYNDNF